MDKFYNMMMSFQKENNITDMCVTNTQYFMDSTNFSAGRKILQARATIAVKIDHRVSADAIDTQIKLCQHMVCQVVPGIKICHPYDKMLKQGNILKQGDIIDPSYEIAKDDYRYFLSAGEVLKAFPLLKKEEAEKVIREHLVFVQGAAAMNDGEIRVSNVDYYNKQADFLQGKWLASL